MVSIKDRKCMDLQKQKILRSGGKNTQKNYIKKFMVHLLLKPGLENFEYYFTNV